MPRHRLAAERDYYRLPAPRPVTISPTAFVACSVVAMGGCTPCGWQAMQELYQLALVQAYQAVHRPHPADVLFGNWN